MKLTCAIVLLGLLTSCNLLEKSSKRSDAVARVGTYYLYQSDLTGLVPEGSHPDDSLELTKSYIDNWIRRHLILMEAESQLSAEQKDVSAKLEEYRQSLLQYRIENEVIAPLMDTVVDSDLIITYFKANKEQLALRRPLMRGRFVKIDRDAPRQDYLRQLIGSKGSRNAKELEEYCFQYASQFQVADTNWLYVDEVMRGTSTEMMQEFSFGQSGVVQQHSDSTHVYLLLLRDYKGVGEAPPLSVEAQNIRSLILLQRRQEFIERYYQDLYKRSLAEKQYEIYTP